MEYRLSRHLQQELGRRGISLQLLDEVMARPEQIVPERDGKMTYQSMVNFGQDRLYLLRVIVNDKVQPPVVVTAYRTGKIRKYWRLA